MTTLAKDILRRVTIEVQDDTSIRWTVPELLMAFNDGQIDILTHRPDAMDSRHEHTCVTGATQKLGDGYTRLIDVPANADGSMRAIRQCGREILDSQRPNWRSMTPAAYAKHFIFDIKEASVFELYPPVLAGTKIIVVASAKPTPLTINEAWETWEDVTGNMALPDEYANALRDYIIYRLYLKDAEYTANDARAMARRQAYADTLGVDLKTTIAVSPSGRAGNKNIPKA